MVPAEICYWCTKVRNQAIRISSSFVIVDFVPELRTWVWLAALVRIKHGIMF